MDKNLPQLLEEGLAGGTPCQLAMGGTQGRVFLAEAAGVVYGPARPFRVWNLTQRASERSSPNPFLVLWGEQRLRMEATLSSLAQS